MALKLSSLEKALMGAIGMDVIRPGTSRQALVKSVKGLGRLTGVAARRGAVPVARGALGAARFGLTANPYALAGLTLAEAYRMGLLDEPIERSQEFLEEGTAGILERGFQLQPDVPRDLQSFGRKAPKRKTSTYNQSVKRGMAALKKSKFSGRPGTIKDSKAAWKQVTQAASAKLRGKKAPKSGAKKAIWKSLLKPKKKSKWSIKVNK